MVKLDKSTGDSLLLVMKSMIGGEQIRSEDSEALASGLAAAALYLLVSLLLSRQIPDSQQGHQGGLDQVQLQV